MSNAGAVPPATEDETEDESLALEACSDFSQFEAAATLEFGDADAALVSDELPEYEASELDRQIVMLNNDIKRLTRLIIRYSGRKPQSVIERLQQRVAAAEDERRPLLLGTLETYELFNGRAVTFYPRNSEILSTVMLLSNTGSEALKGQCTVWAINEAGKADEILFVASEGPIPPEESVYLRAELPITGPDAAETIRALRVFSCSASRFS